MFCVCVCVNLLQDGEEVIVQMCVASWGGGRVRVKMCVVLDLVSMKLLHCPTPGFISLLLISSPSILYLSTTVI